MFCVFTPTNQTCLAANQVAAGCEELLQKAERSSTFCSKVCKCCVFYRPRANTCYAASDKKTVFVYHKLINSCLCDAIPSQFDHSSETSLAGPAGCSNDG